MVLIGAQIPELLERVQDVNKMTFRTGCERLSNAFRTPFERLLLKDGKKTCFSNALNASERFRTRPNALERLESF